MVRAYGLTHINLVVRNVERSLRFYGQVFGVEEMCPAVGAGVVGLQCRADSGPVRELVQLIAVGHQAVPA